MKRVLSILCLTISMFSCSDIFQEQSGVDENQQLFNSKIIGISAKDSVLNPNDASIVALIERYGEERTKSSDANQIKGVVTIKDNAGTPIMYAVNFTEGGYTIVSATKKFYPILARAKEGCFTDDICNTGAAVLLAEFEDYIEIANSLPEDSLRAIDALWGRYEAFEPVIPVSTKSGDLADLVMSSMAQWQAQGLEYHFLSEGNASNYLPDSEYQRFVEAARVNANPNYDYMENSVILIDRIDTHYEKGPLVTTAWDQEDPYNRVITQMIPGVTIYAGCATIATGQIMRYHQYPVGLWHWPSIVNNNEDSIANFIYDIYQGIDCSINSSIDSSDWSSSAEIEDVKDYLTDIGYNAQQVSHSTGLAKASLSLNRPVFMAGSLYSSGDEGGHAWVCDGYVEDKTEITYRLLVIGYAEPLQYETVTSDYIYRTGTTSLYMNWGWGSRSALYTTTGGLDDWFSHTNQFKYRRKDLVHIYPLNLN